VKKERLNHTMTEKRVLLEKFELFYSCLVFICETNVLNLDNNLLCRMKETCQNTKNLISRTKQDDDRYSYWSLEQESAYEDLMNDYFDIIRSISR
jgi:hypothetical protein